jgi:hypothetical protein
VVARSLRRTPRLPAGVSVRAWPVASLGALVLGLAAPGSYGRPPRAVHAGKVSAPLCRGGFRRLRPRHVSFSFSCGNEDVTGFDLQANRALHSVYDPVLAFECQRRTSRSFDCEDIHSGAGPVGSGVATVSEPLCHRGPHLALRVTPLLNFEGQPRPTFTLKGPC